MSVETGSAPQATSQKVFICYRRDETAAHAGRIYDAMVARFGEENVFMDVELAPGVDFEERITEVVSSSGVLLAVMGRNWITAANPDGSRRLDAPDDFVRKELLTALDNPGIGLIPVLVHGAQMPRQDELPPELRPLARRNAIELSDGRWRYDVERLINSLDGLLPGIGRPAPTPTPPAPEPERPPLGWRLALEGILLTAITAVVARVLAQAIYDAPEAGWRWEAIVAGETVPDLETGPELRSHVAEVVGWRTMTFAAIGAVLAIWLGLRIWRSDPFRHLLRGLSVGALAGLLSGAICAVLIYLPDNTVPVDTRTSLDLVSFAVAGGVIGSLVGWLWRPPRVGFASLAGVIGGLLGQAVIVITGWQSTAPLVNGLKFAVVAGSIVGVTLAAMLLADRSEGGRS